MIRSEIAHRLAPHPFHRSASQAERLAPRGIRWRFAAAFACLILAPSVHAQGEVKVGTFIPPMPRGPGLTAKPVVAAPAPAEDRDLGIALASLNTQATQTGEGPALWKALASQTKVSADTLREQRTSSRLNFGDLVAANFLAAGSGNRFDRIVASRNSMGSWSQVARSLRINPASVTARLSATQKSLKRPRK